MKIGDIIKIIGFASDNARAAMLPSGELLSEKLYICDENELPTRLAADGVTHAILMSGDMARDGRVCIRLAPLTLAQSEGLTYKNYGISSEEFNQIIVEHNKKVAACSQE